jgi:hypothetical protein
MASVTAPGYPYAAPPQPPGAPDRPRRRPWLIAVVVAWIVVVTGLGLWSVRRDPATVPEQRDLAAALPVLERATGAVLAAASGDGRVVVLGPLRIATDCRLTPVRAGAEATRDVTVHVPAGRALPVLETIASRLPADYAAEAGASSGGKRVGLQADAGGFVAIDAAADAGTQVLTIRSATGCRPPGDAPLTEPADVPAATTPPALWAVAEALGAPPRASVREVSCPDRKTARTYTVDGVPAPRDLGGTLRRAVSGATVVRAEPAAWAYRTGDDSVVVTRQDDRLRVTVTTLCQ